MASVSLREVHKVFSDGTHAIRGVDLEIGNGEFVVLVGPSGCGKTTLLRLIAGLEEVTAGTILIGERDVTDQPPADRDIAMVFQNYALYPHMAVRDNLAFGLRRQRIQRSVIANKIQGIASVLGLGDLLHRRPAALSGGQRQRVAIGRAMVREPVVYLMDEPLSNLDAKLRVRMRGEIGRLHNRLGATTIYVTHDQTEAMTLGDRVCVLLDGVVRQVDTPRRLYRAPVNTFVAGFIGSPAMNLLVADVHDGEARFGEHRLPLSPEQRVLVGNRDRLVIGLRPSDFRLRPTEFSADGESAPHAARLRIVAEVVEELGSEQLIVFSVEVPEYQGGPPGGTAVDGNEGLLAEPGRSLCTARLDPWIDVRRNQQLDVYFDVEALHLFDAETGVALHHERTRGAAQAFAK